jgi:hypothetical protein
MVELIETDEGEGFDKILAFDVVGFVVMIVFPDQGDASTYTQISSRALVSPA